MIILKRTIALLFLGLLLVGWSFAQEKAASSEHETKLANLNDLGRFLYADGVWRADNLNEKTEAALDSVVHMECYKTGGKELVGTDAYCMLATATINFSWSSRRRCQVLLRCELGQGQGHRIRLPDSLNPCLLVDTNHHQPA